MKRNQQRNYGSVLPSRAGDQFHYLWAARRCLALLSAKDDLKAVSIEGSSERDSSAKGVDRKGAEEVIDIAEYFGSEEIANAERLRYTQLKHSTTRESTPLSLSEIKKTIVGFSRKYSAIKKIIGNKAQQRTQFAIVTNRPVDLRIIESIDAIAKRSKRRNDKTCKILIG